MAGSAFKFSRHIKNKMLTSGQPSFGTDALAWVLINSTHTPNVQTDATYADISANECSGTGYTAGGIAATSVVVADSGDNVSLDADNPVWGPGATISDIETLYLVKGTAGSLVSGDQIVGHYEVEVGGTLAVTNGTFTGQIDATGITVLT